MSWRKHETHAEETKALRKALSAAGINARVGHGTGTAWAWLEINIGYGQQWGEHERHTIGHCSTSCRPCQNLRAMRKRTYEIVREITGRSGEYNGDTNVMQQDHWIRRKGPVPITHPNWPDVTEATPERDTLQQEIDRLRAENAELRALKGDS